MGEDQAAGSVDEERSFKTARVLFAVLFVVSTIVFLLSMPASDVGSPSPTPTRGLDLEPSDPDPPQDGPGIGVIGYVSLLSSVTSIVGLVATTLLGWRSERRASQISELERQRHELEIEKLKMEIEGIRSEQPEERDENGR